MDLSIINHYPQNVKDQVVTLIESGKLNDYINRRYPHKHQVNSDKLLYNYVKDMKGYYMKRSKPIHKVSYCDRVDQVYKALGLNRVNIVKQGRNIKVKNEIVISSIFKKAPEEFLEMIVIHELTHLKIKEHNREFYKLCTHMNGDYFQLEFDFRLYLLSLDLDKKTGL